MPGTILFYTIFDEGFQKNSAFAGREGPVTALMCTGAAATRSSSPAGPISGFAGNSTCQHLGDDLLPMIKDMGKFTLDYKMSDVAERFEREAIFYLILDQSF